LAQGEDIFGEEYACVFGVQLRWSLNTINNIVRVARQIPPDIRRIHLSYRFYCDIAGASLDLRALESFIMLAEDYKREGRQKWRKEVLLKLTEHKVQEKLYPMAPEERDRWMGIWLRNGQPHWRKLWGWIDGTIPVPVDPMAVAEFVALVLKKRLPKDSGAMSYDDVRQVATDCMVDMAKAVKTHLCRVEV
jgi:hypothetical protein